MKYRFENFGGIIAGDDPPMLAFVDRQFMREMSLGPSPLWDTDDESIGLLSAPTEVHMACTNACNAGCPHCYMDSGTRDRAEMDTATFKQAIDVLAGMGVFHVALGGGEALLREDLFELAVHARHVGLVPNLTTSGLDLTERQAEQMTVFGQVNLSLDGVGPISAGFRGRDISRQVDRAVDLLLAAGVATGFNCVLGRPNFDGLDDLFQYAAAKGVNEVEVLRYKPVGRTVSDAYAANRTTFDQNVRLLPMLQDFSARHAVTAKIDCSFVPMLCYHNPPRDLLRATATYGCEAGNVLVGIRSDGQASGCSFLPPTGLSVFDLAAAWTTTPHFDRWRTWPANAAEPCKSCDYLDICKGGCRAVSAHVLGDPRAPDPDCPRVIEQTHPSMPRPSVQS